MKTITFKGAMRIAAALAFTTTAGSAMAWHQLLIKLDGPATKSIFLVGDPQFGGPLQNGFCIRPSPGTRFPRGWYDTNYTLKDRSRVKALAYSSTDCRSGFRREKQMMVPGNDKLGHVYLNLY